MGMADYLGGLLPGTIMESNGKTYEMTECPLASVGTTWIAVAKDETQMKWTLLKVFPEILAVHSSYLRDAFGLNKVPAISILPAPIATAKDNIEDGELPDTNVKASPEPSSGLSGPSPNHIFHLPLMLHSAQFMAIFLQWHSLETDKNEDCPCFWNAILYASSILGSRESERKAIKRLESFSYDKFKPAARISAAIFCGQDLWVRPSLEHLVKCPLKSLELHEVQRLGPGVLHCIVKIREELDTQRKRLAFRPIVFQEATSCIDLCHEAAWKSDWFREVSQHLLHPTQPMGIQDLFERMKVPGFQLGTTCDACTAASVNAALEASIAKVQKLHSSGSPAFRLGHFEADYLEDGLKQLMECIRARTHEMHEALTYGSCACDGSSGKEGN